MVWVAVWVFGGREPGLSHADNQPASTLSKLFALSEPQPAVAPLQSILSRISRPEPVLDSTGKLVQRVDDAKVVYTLDPELQSLVKDIYTQYRVPYGALVAIEPSTGKILALVEHSASEPDARGLCLRATYPAASLIKVITSAAALKTGKVGPDTVVRYEGNPYRLTERKVSPRNAKNDRLTTTLTEALGKSNNVVFAKMGINVVGQAGLEAQLTDFAFNRVVPFDFDLQKSTALVPTDTYPLGRTAAGFGDVYLSPLHAAMIAATVGNGGVMMKPYVVDRVEDKAGDVLHTGVPSEMNRVLDRTLSRTLAQMMTSTVDKGTASKVFNRNAKKLLARMKVAGKTGSLSGDDPPGRYEWFIGFAPLENPRIAVASLVVNKGEMWHIKGAYAAAHVMKKHFGL